MSYPDEDENYGHSVELVQSDPQTLSAINRDEIDMQIATAHKFPRSITQFRKDVFDMVAISESVASECIYALKRGNKKIEGPSARFAEIIANAWGNSRAGARVVGESAEFVTAQGVFHDLQKNVAITFETQRRITDKDNRRYNTDMVGVTGNAAASIALRNAILKGIPKAYWSDMYQRAREVVRGDTATLPMRREKAFGDFAQFGISKDRVIAMLGVAGEADVGIEEIVTLRGFLTALREGDMSAESFGVVETSGKTAAPPPPAERVLMTSEAFEAKKAGWKKLVEGGKKTPNELIVTIETKDLLSEDQKIEIASWFKQREPAVAA